MKLSLVGYYLVGLSTFVILATGCPQNEITTPPANPANSQASAYCQATAKVVGKYLLPASEAPTAAHIDACVAAVLADCSDAEKAILQEIANCYGSAEDFTAVVQACLTPVEKKVSDGCKNAAGKLVPASRQLDPRAMNYCDAVVRAFSRFAPDSEAPTQEQSNACYLGINRECSDAELNALKTAATCFDGAADAAATQRCLSSAAAVVTTPACQAAAFPMPSPAP